MSPSHREARVVTVRRKRSATQSSLEEEIAAVLTMGYFLLGFRTTPTVDRSVMKVIKTVK